MSKPHYIAELPSTTIDPHIAPFFSKFYEISDNPDTHEEYAQNFTEGATVIMGTKRVDGYKDILQFRHGLWTGPVKTRKHSIYKIFPFGDNSNEVMLYGTVDYVLHNGKDVMVEWAGRAVLTEDKGKWKMHFYQVYMDSAPVANALQD